MSPGSFATVLCCIDGRIQRKVNDYLQTTFGARHIDTITTAGIVKHLAAATQQTPILMGNLGISIDGHGSTQIAVVAHNDCAGNRVSDKTQKREISVALQRVRESHSDAEIIGLWLDRNWIIEKTAP